MQYPQCQLSTKQPAIYYEPNNSMLLNAHTWLPHCHCNVSGLLMAGDWLRRMSLKIPIFVSTRKSNRNQSINIVCTQTSNAKMPGPFRLSNSIFVFVFFLFSFLGCALYRAGHLVSFCVHVNLLYCIIKCHFEVHKICTLVDIPTRFLHFHEVLKKQSKWWKFQTSRMICLGNTVSKKLRKTFCKLSYTISKR